MRYGAPYKGSKNGIVDWIYEHFPKLEVDDPPKIAGRYTDAVWNEMGIIGKIFGFSWGGDWKDFQDKPHFEMV